MRRMRWPTLSVSRLTLIGSLVTTTVLIVVVVVASVYGLPQHSGLLRIRAAVPASAEFEQVNRVTHTPKDWIAAVCELPVHPLPHYTRLPHATDTAACWSPGKNGSPVSLLIARFPNEFLLQLDLGNEGYGFYAFAYDAGTMLTIATLSRDSMTSGQGLGVSPALEPLERFRFNIYGRPGLP